LFTSGSWAESPTSQPTQTNPPASTITQLKDIRYGDADGKGNLLDLYLPAKIDKPRPLIVWIHGGGWSMGDKSGCPAVPAVSQGFVVASINYRLSDQAIYPAQILDCKGAIRFLRAHAEQYDIDPKRIGVWGASAGGHLVALLGTSGGSKELEGNVGGNLDQSSRVQAVCDWFGPTDLSKFADEAQAAGIMKTTPAPNLIMVLIGGSLSEKKDLVQLANPISFISKKKAADLPPFLIMHGDQDKLVPVAQSQLLDDALVAAGAKVDFQIISGAGHGIGFNTPKIAKTVLEFFQKSL
jgi:acetyl esterase/lipase